MELGLMVIIWSIVRSAFGRIVTRLQRGVVSTGSLRVLSLGHWAGLYLARIAPSLC